MPDIKKKELFIKESVYNLVNSTVFCIVNTKFNQNIEITVHS